GRLGRSPGETRRREGRARQPVPAGRWANIKNRVADPFGRTPGNLLMAQNTQTESVDQGIAFVALVKIDLPRQSRNPETIPIMAASRHNAAKKPPTVKHRPISRAHPGER